MLQAQALEYYLRSTCRAGNLKDCRRLRFDTNTHLTYACVGTQQLAQTHTC